MKYRVANTMREYSDFTKLLDVIATWREPTVIEICEAGRWRFFGVAAPHNEISRLTHAKRARLAHANH